MSPKQTIYYSNSLLCGVFVGNTGALFGRNKVFEVYRYKYYVYTAYDNGMSSVCIDIDIEHITLH